MFRQLRPCLVLFAAFTLLTGVLYPAVVTLIAQGVFPFRANGSVIERDGRRVGSELIGQSFSDPKYFWGRPSATTPTPYNAASSAGSNLAPSNPDQIKAIKERTEALQKAHPEKGDAAVPADLVTASASGLDPH